MVQYTSRGDAMHALGAWPAPLSDSVTDAKKLLHHVHPQRLCRVRFCRKIELRASA